MINKNFEVSVIALDTNAVVEVDTMLEITTDIFTGNNKTYNHYPKKLQLINATGQTIKYNILSNEIEYQEYLKSAVNYDLITLNNNEKIIWSVTDILPTAYKILVQMPTGSASAIFQIECIGYHPRYS